MISTLPADCAACLNREWPPYWAVPVAASVPGGITPVARVELNVEKAGGAVDDDRDENVRGPGDDVALSAAFMEAIGDTETGAATGG